MQSQPCSMLKGGLRCLQRCGRYHSISSSKEATKALARCKRPAELIKLVRATQESQQVDGIFCAAALQRLSVLEQRDVLYTAEAWSLVSDLVSRKLSKLGAQELAMAALAVGKARRDSKLLEGILNRVSPGLAVSNEPLSLRHCANLAWAVASLHLHSPEFFQDLLLACRQREANARDAAQLLWSFARAQEAGLELLELLKVEDLGHFGGHDLATTVWAVATMSSPGPKGLSLLQKLADVAGSSELTPQGLSMVCWGYATLQLEVNLWKTLLPKVMHQNFTPQGASNILWAMATVAGKDMGQVRMGLF